MEERKEGKVKAKEVIEDPLEGEVRIKRKFMMWVPTEIRRVIILIALVIKIMVNNEEEEEEGQDKDLGEGFRGTSFQYGEEGYRAYECPQHQGRTKRRNEGHAQVAHVDEEALMNEEKVPDQRKHFFCTRCKCEDKCCNVIIDSRSTYNLLLKEMVMKLRLKRERQPNLYWIV